MTFLKALSGMLGAFALMFWISPQSTTPTVPPQESLPSSWVLDESLDVRGRRLRHWTSPLGSAEETRFSAEHFRARGLAVDEAHEEGEGGMITFVEGGQRLIINIISTEGGSAITEMALPTSKEVTP